MGNSKKKAPLRNVKNVVFEKKLMHYEDSAKEAKVSFDVAGFTDADINIQLEKEEDHRVVHITGERTNALGDVFNFDRKFRLNEKTVDVDRIDATIEDGILEVVVQKKAKSGPRVIKVSTASSKKTTAAATISNNSNSSDSALVESVTDGASAGVDEKKEVIIAQK